MLQLPGQPATYIIVDSVDECPNTSGVLSPRERVLELVEELVNLRLLNLHLSFTSRPDADIVAALLPLASRIVPLQDQSGQKTTLPTTSCMLSTQIGGRGEEERIKNLSSICALERLTECKLSSPRCLTSCLRDSTGSDGSFAS